MKVTTIVKRRVNKLIGCCKIAQQIISFVKVLNITELLNSLVRRLKQRQHWECVWDNVMYSHNYVKRWSAGGSHQDKYISRADVIFLYSCAFDIWFWFETFLCINFHESISGVHFVISSVNVITYLKLWREEDHPLFIQTEDPFLLARDRSRMNFLDDFRIGRRSQVRSDHDHIVTALLRARTHVIICLAARWQWKLDLEFHFIWDFFFQLKWLMRDALSTWASIWEIRLFFVRASWLQSCFQH